MSEAWTPLFPLRTVLFPDGPLPLRVFEARYLDMVSRCLRDDRPFGVLLLSEGSEAGEAQRTAAVGTLARVTDWYQGSDGLLGITALGTERFRLGEVRRQDDGLYVGRIGPFGAEPAIRLPQGFEPLAQLLQAVLADLGKLYDDLPRRYDDATWVGCRFAEVLPMPLERKQHCLELTDPIARLEFVRPMLRTVRWETTQ
ncbi:MAG: LON peptidase substrate-binding domain-containing protein [Gammaproteobacteria bacterium]|nr:LON peptidase substrate-binding domain-containing protein [Gammaproteobacteria bacterium]